jgi:hypothetical protein
MDYIGGPHGQSVYLALTGHHSPRMTGDDVQPSSEDYPDPGPRLQQPLRPVPGRATAGRRHSSRNFWSATW